MFLNHKGVEQVFHAQCGENCRCLIPDQHGPVGFLGSECGSQYVIDILWSYTDAAHCYRLDQPRFWNPNPIREILPPISFFSNSELPFSVRSVGITPVAYDESAVSIQSVIRTMTAMRFRTIEDDELQTDIVVLITETGFCGQAYALRPANPELGFQTISAGCLGPLQVLAHSGAQPWIKHFSSDAGGFFDYSCGHVLPLPGQPGTAMGGNALPHYSNPRVSYNGVATESRSGNQMQRTTGQHSKVTGPMVINSMATTAMETAFPFDLDIDSGFDEDCDPEHGSRRMPAGRSVQANHCACSRGLLNHLRCRPSCPNGSTVMVGPGSGKGNIIISGERASTWFRRMA